MEKEKKILELPKSIKTKILSRIEDFKRLNLDDRRGGIAIDMYIQHLKWLSDILDHIDREKYNIKITGDIKKDGWTGIYLQSKSNQYEAAVFYETYSSSPWRVSGDLIDEYPTIDSIKKSLENAKEKIARMEPRIKPERGKASEEKYKKPAA